MIPQRGLTLNIPALHTQSRFSVIVSARVVFFFPCSRRVFFLVLCFKQVKTEVSHLKCPEKSPGICLVMGKRLEQKSHRVLNSERKKKNVHKLIEMSQELMDLHNDRPTKNRNTSVLVCRGSAHPTFLHSPHLSFIIPQASVPGKTDANTTHRLTLQSQDQTNTSPG